MHNDQRAVHLLPYIERLTLQSNLLPHISLTPYSTTQYTAAASMYPLLIFKCTSSKMNSPQIPIVLSFLLLHLVYLPYTSAATFGANDTDRLALQAIRSKITLDPQGVTTSWNDSFHYCQWQGVTCGHRHQRVTALDLSSRGLVGSLSPYMGNLTFLKDIRLYNNTLGGRIPPEIGRLFRLQVLYLFLNSLEGEIPANLSHCTHLTVLSLGSNKLVGKIPKELGSLTMLKRLSILFNNFSGGIPLFTGNLTSLEILSLNGCHLGGSIPNIYHKLTSLKHLGFYGNDLIGTIPSSIFNLSLLEIIELADNQLRGILPTSLGLMQPHLRIINLGVNHFTGSLPPTISNCSELEILDAMGNHFSGKVAINFGNLQNLRQVFWASNNLGSGERDEMTFIDSMINCSNLEALELANNNFRGMLPNTLGNFSTRLRMLSLGQNSFYGSLPSSIGNLFNLTVLVLYFNQFTGTIPISIGNLLKLTILSLHHNNFFGNIPDSIGNLSQLINLQLAVNKIDGTIPSSLGNCRNLQYLSFYQNNLSGSIPREIFELSSLSIVLDLGRNHLSGPLPVEVSSLRNLGILSLSENKLSGELPSGLGSYSSLELLELDSNLFQGSIPTSLSSLKSLRSLNLSHNNFSGPIPRNFEENHLENLDISFNDFEGEVPMKGVFANSSAISVQGNNRLCGGMSILQLRKCSFNDSKGRHKLSTVLIVVISMASALVGVAIMSFFLFCWCPKKRKDQRSGVVLKESFLQVSYERLLKATDGFSSENLIGVGAFAAVYKGILDEDGVIVAVKVLNLEHRGSLRSFIAECDALRHVRHRNLIKVITCCSSVDFQGNDFKAIVYEFMPNGSLDWWLHSSPSAPNEVPQLRIPQRISIAIDVACALEYLHNNSDHPIVHCDLKPSNILLDQNMVARLGDFGLARFLLPEVSNANTSSTFGIRGTVGYAPPEYGLGNEVSRNGDVYSYGILLLEMVTGKRPTDPLFQEGLNLHTYASMGLANRKLEIVEPMLLNDKNEECLILMLKIGVACSVDSPQERMDITRAVQELNTLKGNIISD